LLPKCPTPSHFEEAAVDSARFEYLIALKCSAEEKARKGEGRNSRQWWKLALAYAEMAMDEMKKAAANRGPEV
jgi:hypothetical protein